MGDVAGRRLCEDTVCHSMTEHSLHVFRIEVGGFGDFSESRGLAHRNGMGETETNDYVDRLPGGKLKRVSKVLDVLILGILTVRPVRYMSDCMGPWTRD